MLTCVPLVVPVASTTPDAEETQRLLKSSPENAAPRPVPTNTRLSGYKKVGIAEIAVSTVGIDVSDDGSDDSDNSDGEEEGSENSQLTMPVAAPTQNKLGGCARLRVVLCTRNIMICTVLYAVLGMIGIVVDEIFPLWTLTPPSSGGFNFTSSDIGECSNFVTPRTPCYNCLFLEDVVLIFMIHVTGIAVTVAGPFQLIGTIFVYPRLIDKFGYLRVFQVCLNPSASGTGPAARNITILMERCVTFNCASFGHQGCAFMYSSIVLVAPHLSYFNTSERSTIFVVLSTFYTLQVRCPM